MKKNQVLAAVVLTATIIAVNGFKSQKKGSTAAMSLINITALQAGASEAYCNPISQNFCQVSNGTATASGFGQPVLTW